MPRIVLPLSSVAYSVLALLQLQNKNFPVSPRDGIIQMPGTTFEAANGGANIRFGSPNSNTAPTDVTSPDFALTEDATIPLRDLFGYPLSELFAKGSANNVVLYVQGS